MNLYFKEHVTEYLLLAYLFLKTCVTALVQNVTKQTEENYVQIPTQR